MNHDQTQTGRPGISHICYGFPGTDLTADMLLEMEEAAGSGLFFRVVTD